MLNTAPQANFGINVGQFPLPNFGDNGSDIHLLNALIITNNIKAITVIRDLLKEISSISIQQTETANLANAIRKLKTENFDLAVFVTEGWSKDEIKRFSESLELIEDCPLIIASMDYGESVVDLLQAHDQFDLRNPTAQAMESAINNTLYTHELQRRLINTTAELQIAMRDKTRFFAHMSHDLKTPLNAIIGFSDAIKHGIYGDPPEPEDLEYIDRINLVSTQLLNKINDLIDSTACQDDDM